MVSLSPVKKLKKDFFRLVTSLDKGKILSPREESNLRPSLVTRRKTSLSQSCWYPFPPGNRCYLMKLKFILECFIFQTETEFQEWMKEIKQSFQQAQVMMRAGAKIMSSGHRYITQYSKEENGPVSP